MPRTMHLMAYLKTGATAVHPGGWRHPQTDLHDVFSPSRYEHIAKVLEAACFDGCFYADTLGIPDVHTGSIRPYVEHGGQLSHLDPMMVLPVMARVTRHLGLGATLSTTFHQAYHLARMLASILFVEQPINRKNALEADFRATPLGLPVIIDESDGTLDTFVEARARGYDGVSSKTCKGMYKSILNAARCAQWNAAAGGTRYFMSAEDLTTQAGLAVQQDLALVNLLGITHVERNGHHYVNGMAALPQAEQQAFLAAHGDL